MTRPAMMPPLPPASVPARAVAFSVGEAAEYLHVSPQTIYRMIRTGALKHVRPGATIRIRRDALDEWIRAEESRAWQCSARGQGRRGARRRAQ